MLLLSLYSILVSASRRQWLRLVCALLVDKSPELRRSATDAAEALFLDVDEALVNGYASYATGPEAVRAGGEGQEVRVLQVGKSEGGGKGFWDFELIVSLLKPWPSTSGKGTSCGPISWTI